MPEASDTVDSIARKSLTAMLNAIERVGQNTIAEGCGVDNSTITGDKTKYWPRFARTLAIAGLKVVPSTSRCYAPDVIEPLLALAKQRLAEIETVDQLQWGDQ